MLLDVVEVAESHTGEALAVAFAKVLQDFGIEHKVGTVPALMQWDRRLTVAA